MKQFLKNNGLSVAFFVLFLFAITGQAITGQKQHNQEMEDNGGEKVGMIQYLGSGHFLQATFENWESEFLQMALFVTLSISLFQKGSSESKDPDKKEKVDDEPNPQKKDAPWPVKRGGWLAGLYSNSLSLALWLMFLICFLGHWQGSLKDYNQEQLLKGKPIENSFQYLSNSRLWFESFQNWQSEYLSVFAIIVLTIFLRQKGSPQSKPVDAPNSETGD